MKTERSVVQVECVYQGKGVKDVCLKSGVILPVNDLHQPRYNIKYFASAVQKKHLAKS